MRMPKGELSDLKREERMGRKGDEDEGGWLDEAVGKVSCLSA